MKPGQCARCLKLHAPPAPSHGCFGESKAGKHAAVRLCVVRSRPRGPLAETEIRPRPDGSTSTSVSLQSQLLGRILVALTLGLGRLGNGSIDTGIDLVDSPEGKQIEHNKTCFSSFRGKFMGVPAGQCGNPQDSIVSNNYSTLLCTKYYIVRNLGTSQIRCKKPSESSLYFAG